MVIKLSRPKKQQTPSLNTDVGIFDLVPVRVNFKSVVITKRQHSRPICEQKTVLDNVVRKKIVILIKQC